MINPKIQFVRIRDVHAPSRACENDAGTDFYIPHYNESFKQVLLAKNSGLRMFEVVINGQQTELEICIPPHGKIEIPSGIKVNILDKRTYLDVNNKSGISTQKGLTKLAQVIDAGYRGEIFFSISNSTAYEVTVKTGQKIVQLIQKEYIPTEWEEITVDEYSKLEDTDRGEGQQGSSGLN